MHKRLTIGLATEEMACWRSHADEGGWRLAFVLMAVLVSIGCGKASVPVEPGDVDTGVSPTRNSIWDYRSRESSYAWVDVAQMKRSALAPLARRGLAELGQISEEQRAPSCIQDHLRQVEQLLIVPGKEWSEKEDAEEMLAVMQMGTSQAALEECLRTVPGGPTFTSDPDRYGGRPLIDASGVRVVRDGPFLVLGQEPEAALSAAEARGSASSSPSAEGARLSLAPPPPLGATTVFSAFMPEVRGEPTDLRATMRLAPERVQLSVGLDMGSPVAARKLTSRIEEMAKQLAIHLDALSAEDEAMYARSLGISVEELRERRVLERFRAGVSNLELRQRDSRATITLELDDQLFELPLLEAIFVHGRALLVAMALTRGM